MASDYPNPVRGYLLCPVCGERSSIHLVGEGRMMATGEPPKNKHNIGKMYYCCPQCGSSNKTPRIQDFIQANRLHETPQHETQASRRVLLHEGRFPMKE